MAIGEALRCSSPTVSESQQLLPTRKLPPVHSTMNVRRPTLSARVSAESEKHPPGSNADDGSVTLPRRPRSPTDDSQTQHVAPQLNPAECRRTCIESESGGLPATQQSPQRTAAPMPRLPSILSRFSKQALSDHEAKDLATRLALLLHARECCKGGTGCDVRNCSIARGVLDHCQECFLPDGKCHASCSQAKHLLRHFRICKARNFPQGCQICGLLHSEFSWAIQHSRSLAPLFLHNQQEPSSSTSPVMGSINQVCFAPVSLRRVVSDDPNMRRPLSSLPLNPAKRQRQMSGLSHFER